MVKVNMRKSYEATGAIYTPKWNPAVNKKHINTKERII